MAYSAKAVANYFLALAEVDGVSITPMKMQKLIFYAHGWFLALANEPLINETVEAWEYGPVVPSVYKAFREFGNDRITAPAKEIRLVRNAYHEEIPEIPDGPTHEDTRNVLRKVWDVYKPLSAIQLSNMTHADGTPWSIVRKSCGPDIPMGLQIHNDLIKDYFVHGIGSTK